MKKIICIAICVIMAFAFVGCSNTATTTPDPEETAAADTAEPTEEPVAEETATPEEETATAAELPQEVHFAELTFNVTKDTTLHETSEPDENTYLESYYIVDDEGTGIAGLVVSYMDNKALGITADDFYSTPQLYEALMTAESADINNATIAGLQALLYTDTENNYLKYGFATDNYTYLITVSPFDDSDESVATMIDIITSIKISDNVAADTSEPVSVKSATPSTTTSSATKGEQNALRKAKDYLNVMSFSYSGLIDQLEYEGYTTEEATYGADNCGADWNEQAALKAESYLDIMAFSRSGLIDQLEYEGFTSAQAEYGVNAVGL